MGARPLDFDESIVRQAPTFQKWTSLANGQKLKYACRDFIKGHGEDEERLMRRIMIARRNNLRDHEILKRARAQTFGVGGGDVGGVGVGVKGSKGSVKQPSFISMITIPTTAAPKNSKTRTVKPEKQTQMLNLTDFPTHNLLSPNPTITNTTTAISTNKPEAIASSIKFLPPPQHLTQHIPKDPHTTIKPDNTTTNNKKKRTVQVAFPMSDAEVLHEMDGPAVEATRSYKTWLCLPDEAEFTYNQRYIKGKCGHDWLLRKNIWRRMRYRRENKKMVEKLKVDVTTVTGNDVAVPMGGLMKRELVKDNDNRVTATMTSASIAAAATQIVDGALLVGGHSIPTSTTTTNTNNNSNKQTATTIGVLHHHHTNESNNHTNTPNTTTTVVPTIESAEDTAHTAALLEATDAAHAAAELYVQKTREEADTAAVAAALYIQKSDESEAAEQALYVQKERGGAADLIASTETVGVMETTAAVRSPPPLSPPLPVVSSSGVLVKIERCQDGHTGNGTTDVPPSISSTSIGGLVIHDGVQTTSGVVMVHNPIIRTVPPGSDGAMTDLTQQQQPMTHTPNPLVGLHGVALDVAAQLAAAASASVVEQQHSHHSAPSDTNGISMDSGQRRKETEFIVPV